MMFTFIINSKLKFSPCLNGNPESWLNLFLEFFMKDCTPPTEEKTREGYHGGFEMNRYPPFLLLLLFVVSFWFNEQTETDEQRQK